jgi:hypothetical protein
MNGDQKIYRTFEEFEREELRRADGMSSTMDELLGDACDEELDFDAAPKRGLPAHEDEDS